MKQTLFDNGGSSTSSISHVYRSTDNGVSWHRDASAELPTSMAFHQAVVFNDAIWLFYKNKAYTYDEQNTQWVERGFIPAHSNGFDYQVTEFRGRLWMTGGDKTPYALLVSEDGLIWNNVKQLQIEFP